MKKSILNGFVSGWMLLSGSSVLADNVLRTSDGQAVKWRAEEPLESRADSYPQEWQGAGVGGVVGAIVAGPAGLVVGLTGGAMFGRQAAIESELSNARQQVTDLQQSLSKMRLGRQDSLQQRGGLVEALALAKERINQQLHQFAQGFVLNISFRTEASTLEEQYKPQLTKLAHLLKQLPLLDIHINAYTDARGSLQYNQQLAERRAESVNSFFYTLGIGSDRIFLNSHGESNAMYLETDIEGTGFDRQILITFCVKEAS